MDEGGKDEKERKGVVDREQSKGCNYFELLIHLLHTQDTSHIFNDSNCSSISDKKGVICVTSEAERDCGTLEEGQSHMGALRVPVLQVVTFIRYDDTELREEGRRGERREERREKRREGERREKRRGWERRGERIGEEGREERREERREGERRRKGEEGSGGQGMRKHVVSGEERRGKWRG
jgi:hypothetical protein